jgi:Ca2+-binding EF-hand superfamily protein
LNFEFSNDEYRDIFHKADTDANGYIEIDEFLQMFENDILEEE